MTLNSIKATIVIGLLMATSVIFAQKEFQGKASYVSKTTIDMNRFGTNRLSNERKKQIADCLVFNP